MPELRTLYRYMLAELGLEQFTPEQQQEMAALLGENILKAVALATLMRLPPKAQQTYQELSIQGRAEELDAIARKHIKNYDAFVAAQIKKEVDEFKLVRDEAWEKHQ